MKRFARIAAGLLPALGLAALWGQSHHAYQQGTEWEVPVMGYDPRDMLRGHYVEFTYDWPGLETRDFGLQPDALCLAGKPPRIDEVFMVGDAAWCTHPLRADSNAVYGSDGLRRGRLYLDQYKAAMIDAQLRDPDQRGIVTIRQRGDGSFTPVAIRFRPLTPEERAVRDGAGNGRPPPAIMDAP